MLVQADTRVPSLSPPFSQASLPRVNPFLALLFSVRRWLYDTLRPTSRSESRRRENHEDTEEEKEKTLS